MIGMQQNAYCLPGKQVLCHRKQHGHLTGKFDILLRAGNTVLLSKEEEEKEEEEAFHPSSKRGEGLPSSKGKEEEEEEESGRNFFFVWHKLSNWGQS